MDSIVIRTKVCENKCPACGSKEIEWDAKDYCEDAEIMQDGTCIDCGQEFTEYSHYYETQWETKEQK